MNAICMHICFFHKFTMCAAQVIASNTFSWRGLSEQQLQKGMVIVNREFPEHKPDQLGWFDPAHSGHRSFVSFNDMSQSIAPLVRVETGKHAIYIYIYIYLYICVYIYTPQTLSVCSFLCIQKNIYRLFYCVHLFSSV